MNGEQVDSSSVRNRMSGENYITPGEYSILFYKDQQMAINVSFRRISEELRKSSASHD